MSRINTYFVAQWELPTKKENSRSRQVRKEIARVETLSSAIKRVSKAEGSGEGTMSLGARVGASASPSSLQFSSVAQSCLTLCGPMDCNPPGSSVLGILQVRIPERVAIPSSRGCFPPRD